MYFTKIPRTYAIPLQEIILPNFIHSQQPVASGGPRFATLLLELSEVGAGE
jgi:hypothetical protein